MFGEDDEDEIIIYGTPLPPLEENENASKKPELDLTVRDWKGRRRFHGAFTGGFSAGYFNTVGTEKGWIPSQYVSKKGERWDKNLVSNKPEDFMDEEDFSLFGIAPKKVHTKDNFKGPQAEAFAGLRDPNASLIDVLRDIIKPTTQSIGVKLFTIMKKGRKYKGAFTKLKTNTKVYGCSMPPQFSTSKDKDDHDSDDGESTLRSEIFSLPYTPKNDFHGIGYKPLKAVTQSEEEKSTPLTAVLSGNKRLMISGEAFGYGALEDEDDDYADDATIYSKVDLSKYDFEIGSVKKVNPKQASTSALPSTRKNGNILEGFSLAMRIEPIISSKNKLPVIPKNWKPHPPFLKSKRASRWNQSSSTSESNKSTLSSSSTYIELFSSQGLKPFNKPKSLDANTRGVLLGEEIDLVVGIKKKNETDPSTITQESEGKKIETNQPKPPSHPMSAFFSNRFVQSSEVEEDQLKPGLVEASSISHLKTKSAPEDEQIDESRIGKTKRETFQWHPHTLLCKRFNVPHPYPQFPDVIGVINISREPVIPENKTLTANTKIKPNIFKSLNDSSSIPAKPSTSATIEKKIISPPSSSSSTTVTLTEKSPEKIPEKIERPPLDLFKAIFASDESETDDENEDKDKSKEEESTKSTVNLISNEKDTSETAKSAKEANEQSIDLVSRDQVILSQPSTSKVGIFSGLNLDLINKKISYAIPTKDHDDSDNDDDVTYESQVIGKDKQDDVMIEDSYGPALPPPLPPMDNLNKSYTKSSSSHKRKDKKRKKSRSRSKHKSKKSKSKHRRRSTSTESSDESDSSSDSDEIHGKKRKSTHSKR